MAYQAGAGFRVTEIKSFLREGNEQFQLISGQQIVCGIVGGERGAGELKRGKQSGIKQLVVTAVRVKLKTAVQKNPFLIVKTVVSPVECL